MSGTWTWDGCEIMASPKQDTSSREKVSETLLAALWKTEVLPFLARSKESHFGRRNFQRASDPRPSNAHVEGSGTAPAMIDWPGTVL